MGAQSGPLKAALILSEVISADSAWERTQEEPSTGGWCHLSIMATAAVEQTNTLCNQKGGRQARGQGNDMVRPPSFSSL